MNENYRKYRLVLGGDLIEDFHPDTIKALIQEWADETGARNVSSGVIQADLNHEVGAVIYSAYFDSSHWTGIGFKGFKG